MLEFEAGYNKEYEVEAIQDNVVYAKKANKYLLKLYYLIIWKGYLQEENTWKSSLVVMHLRNMISTFHKDYPKKPIATSASLNSVPSMEKLTIKLFTNGKQRRQVKSTIKCVR